MRELVELKENIYKFISERMIFSLDEYIDTVLNHILKSKIELAKDYDLGDNAIIVLRDTIFIKETFLEMPIDTQVRLIVSDYIHGDNDGYIWYSDYGYTRTIVERILAVYKYLNIHDKNLDASFDDETFSSNQNKEKIALNLVYWD